MHERTFFPEREAGRDREGNADCLDEENPGTEELVQDISTEYLRQMSLRKEGMCRWLLTALISGTMGAVQTIEYEGEESVYLLPVWNALQVQPRRQYLSVCIVARAAH